MGMFELWIIENGPEIQNLGKWIALLSVWYLGIKSIQFRRKV